MLVQAVLLILFTSFLTNGIIVLFEKWGFIEYLQGVSKRVFLQKMFDCLFCISHHIAFLIVSCWCIFDFQFIYVFVPLSVAGLINKIN